MGLYVAVWMPEYEEWVRCATVTPTANQRDFTCELLDWGDKKNVKVENCCYLFEKFLKYPRLSRQCKLVGINPRFGDTYTEDAYDKAKSFYFGDKQNIDEPDENIELSARFFHYSLEVAYVEIRDEARPDQESGEPTTIQSHLSKNRHVHLEQDYLHNIGDGISVDDSVSQVPRKPTIRQKVSKPPNLGVPQHVHSTRETLRKHRVAINPRERERTKENYKNNISAKEKTGVDPLSQINKPLDSAKDETLKNMFYTDTTSGSGRKDWSTHRDAPKTTVGPAEALSRGTLNPPHQVTPAKRYTDQQK